MGGSRHQEEQGFKEQGSESLPRGGDPHTVATATIAPEADVETVPAEVADDHAVPVRIDARGADIDRRQEVDVPDRLVCRESPDHFCGVGHHLEIGEKLLLLAPRLGRRVRHDAFAEHVPAACHLVVASESFALFGVPAALLAVEVAPLEFADVKERHLTGRARHEVVVVAAQPLEGLLVGKRLLELGDLLLGVGQTTGGGDLLGGDEVVAEDLSNQFVVRSSGRVATDERHEVILEVATLTDQALDAVLVGTGLSEGVFHEAVDLLLLRRDPLVGLRLYRRSDEQEREDEHDS